MTDSSTLAHFKAFRATFNPGDEVDEESGLTADDLDAAIKALEVTGKLVSIPTVDLSQPGAWEKIAETIRHRE